jgi:hypothetical protein
MTITALRGFVANEYAQSDARAEALRLHANATVIEARLPRRCIVATHERDQHLGQPARHFMVAA